MKIIDKLKTYLYTKKYEDVIPEEEFEKVDNLKVVKIKFVEHITSDRGTYVSALISSDESLGIAKMDENNIQGLELTKNKIMPCIYNCLNFPENNHYLEEKNFGIDQIVPLKNVLRQYSIENDKSELSKTEIKELLEEIKIRHYGSSSNSKCDKERGN